MRLVSVDPELVEIKDHLSQCGYEVLNMHEYVRPVEAVVYNGQPVTTKAGGAGKARSTVLINASGLKPEDVVVQLEDRF